MKRCPECRRDYYDDSLSYCLDDGSVLLEGPASYGGSETAVLPAFGVVGEANTLLGHHLPAQSTSNVNSVAVLPFVNLSGDPANEYLSDGMAEELLNALSKIRGFRVAARTSAFSFKNKNMTVGEIGHTLNVESILEGSVRLAGKRLRVAVQLANVQDGYHLWSQTYDRTLDDIFEVQDDIAETVVEELRERLLGREFGTVETGAIEVEVANAFKGRADDPEAQRLLLLGRHFLDRTTREDTARAIGYFREALELDPEFALCWAELARAFTVEAGRGWASVDEAREKIRTAVDRALELEPALAEGYAMRERLEDTYEWDLAAAERSMQMALKLAPANASILDRAGILAYKTGKLDDSISLLRRAVAQDPLSAAIWHNLGLVTHAAGHLEDAEKAYRRALELAPQRFLSSAFLSLVLIDQGKTVDARAQALIEPEEFWRIWALAILDHLSGRPAESDANLKRLIEEYSEGSAFQIAEIYAEREEPDQAFDWLERAVQERDPGITHSKANPRFRNLHKDPRWGSVLETIGFQS
jgi:TolB-like protein/Tfp pilus assembly protein PilF